VVPAEALGDPAQRRAGTVVRDKDLNRAIAVRLFDSRSSFDRQKCWFDVA